MAFFLMHQQCWFCDSQIGAVDRWRALKASSAACWEIISYVQCFLGEGFPGKGLKGGRGLFLFIYYFLVFVVVLLLVLRWWGGASICTEYAFWRTLYNVYNGKLTFPPMCGEILYVETYLYIVWPLYIYTYKWLWSLWPFVSFYVHRQALLTALCLNWNLDMYSFSIYEMKIIKY